MNENLRHLFCFYFIQTKNSNDFATYGQSGFTDYGVGPEDEGLYTGFVVRLDPRVFPVFTDASTDVVSQYFFRTYFF